MTRRTLLALVMPALSSFLAFAQQPAETDMRPTVWLIGDSTVNVGTAGQRGWGSELEPFLDPTRVRLINRARGGRSSRTFLTEGLWDAVMAELKPGDFVLMQFGHNDGGDKFKGTRPRASIKGVGDETETGVVEATGKTETVRSYGWYLRQYVQGAKSKGATAIVLSPVPRNIWKDGKVNRNSGDYGGWAKAVAKQEKVFFLDLNERIAKKYEADGEPVVASRYFDPKDHTHTLTEGAQVSAQCVAEGILALKKCSLRKMVKREALRGGR